MCPSKITVIVCSFILIVCSIFLSKFFFYSRCLNPDDNFPPRNFTSKYNYIDNSPDNVEWLIQISDIHISLYHDKSRITDFMSFCNETIDVIKPRVVIASGDLTDSKSQNQRKSGQYEEEWIIYRKVLNEANISEKVLWLDIRGNHDNFDVLSINSKNNLFRKYSVQGPTHPRSYFYVHDMPNGEKMGFIAVDACLEVGTRLPFNFVGQLTSKEMETLHSYSEAARNIPVDYLFWFGHYPTSTIQYPEAEEFRNLIASHENSVAYFCGHFHELGGLVPQMYAYQKKGFFELEVSDWRENRMFRLMAIDHGQFSFADVKHNSWPIVLVTNPKTVYLVPPVKESVILSSHIRMLVFSPVRITNVIVRVDNNEWINCTNAKGPLYVCKWNPDDYEEGLHLLTINITDVESKTSKREHQFSLDGTRLKSKFLPRLFLMPNLGMMFCFLFTATVLSSSAPLLMFRYLVKSNQVNPISLAKVRNKFFSRWIRRLCIISSIDTFFYPLFLYPLYLLVGPWAILNIVEDNIGVIFSWGVIVSSTFVPVWVTYPFGYLQIIVHVFLIFHLSRQIDRRCFNLINKKEPYSTSYVRILLHFLWENKFFIFVISIQAWDSYKFWLSFGNFTLMFCPLKLWWLLMAIWLRRKIHTIKKDKLLRVTNIWLSS